MQQATGAVQAQRAADSQQASLPDLRPKSGGGPPEVLAIVLAQGLEDGRACRGVHAHGKGLRAEEHLDEALAEEHLHHLLQDGQQPCAGGAALDRGPQRLLRRGTGAGCGSWGQSCVLHMPRCTGSPVWGGTQASAMALVRKHWLAACKRNS